MSAAENTAYIDNRLKASQDYEALCKQCGKCCGLETDPCINLKKGPLGKYYCAVYDSRLGRQLTVSGRAFTCVEIRELTKFGLPNEECGYGR